MAARVAAETGRLEVRAPFFLSARIIMSRSLVGWNKRAPRSPPLEPMVICYPDVNVKFPKSPTAKTRRSKINPPTTNNRAASAALASATMLARQKLNLSRRANARRHNQNMMNNT